MSFDIFYRGGNRNRLNRGAGGGNQVFTCACTSCEQTVQVFASNIREAQRRCARRGQQVGCNCTSMAPRLTQMVR